jgi:hypothetical protein
MLIKTNAIIILIHDINMRFIVLEDSIEEFDSNHFPDEIHYNILETLYKIGEKASRAINYVKFCPRCKDKLKLNEYNHCKSCNCDLHEYAVHVFEHNKMNKTSHLCKYCINDTFFFKKLNDVNYIIYPNEQKSIIIRSDPPQIYNKISDEFENFVIGSISKILTELKINKDIFNCNIKFEKTNNQEEYIIKIGDNKE